MSAATDGTSACFSFADAVQEAQRCAVAVCDARGKLWAASGAVNAVRRNTRLGAFPSEECAEDALARAVELRDRRKQQLMCARQARHAAVGKAQNATVAKPANWAGQLVEAIMSAQPRQEIACVAVSP